MKTKLLKTSVLLLFPFLSISQTLENIDYIAPLQDNLIAIEKDGAWAFINSKGDMVIEFRDDIVATWMGLDSYPIYASKRILIKSQRDGISYFGYIDNSGKTVVEPQFLNATNFNQNQATVLKPITSTVGHNDMLDKDIVYHRYCEVVIDRNGKVLYYLNPKGINVVLDKKFLEEPPAITSKKMSEELYALKSKNGNWKIIELKDTSN